ncbi:hypothetical protein GB931_18425 [Modestobacter sp. I12A-02628]|uniref:Uncharacterized protein n=1 Tax=Goekera deserti TaxID=2497753 RepID=A0A7K3W934_9ACTN|nr:hypothetical protein [Goekera deserti]MPQ99856.1 hypothetical protein [Goekera deserti]NDI50014.1 hypothetical protein [Goekera deserti]NEL52509.1 hypothetical protein [Goekera deserti]
MKNTMTWDAPAAPTGLGVLAARPYAWATPVAATALPVDLRAGVLSGLAAPIPGTGASSVGAAIRFRGLIAAAGSTGLHTTGAGTAERTVQLKNTIPGELPPRDPLS